MNKDAYLVLENYKTKMKSETSLFIWHINVLHFKIIDEGMRNIYF